MHTARSASFTASESRSASEYTWTVSIPRSRHVRFTRTAISPRLAISTRRIGIAMLDLPSAVHFELEIHDLGAGLPDDDRVQVERQYGGLGDGERRYAGNDPR